MADRFADQHTEILGIAGVLAEKAYNLRLIASQILIKGNSAERNQVRSLMDAADAMDIQRLGLISISKNLKAYSLGDS